MVSRPDDLSCQPQTLHGGTATSPDAQPSQPSSLSPTLLQNDIVSQAPPPPGNAANTSPTTRFVSNKIEKCWILQQLTVHGAPTQKGKMFEKICAGVATSAKQRHINDQDLLHQQSMYGMSWRKTYLASITPLNVTYIASRALKQAQLIACSDLDEDDGIVVATVRPGGKQGDVQHLLDQALLDYKIEAEKKVICSDDSAGKVLTRRKESRKENAQRLAKRKLDYKAEKNGREQAKKKGLQELRAADSQLLKAQTMNANAAVASAAVTARQTEQFGAFLALYAQKNNLPMPQLTTSMPPALSVKSLEMDDSLLAKEPTVTDKPTTTLQETADAAQEDKTTSDP